MDLMEYLERSKFSIPDKNRGIVTVAGICSAVAALTLLFSAGYMSVSSALYFLAAVGLAVCCFAFEHRNFGYCLVPLALGIIASIFGAFTYVLLIIRYGLWADYVMGIACYMIFAAAFTVVVMYFIEMVDDPSIPVIVCGISAGLGFLFSFFVGSLWNFAYIILIVSILLLSKAAAKGELPLVKDSVGDIVNFDPQADISGRTDMCSLGGLDGIYEANFGSENDKALFVATRMNEEKNLALCVIFTIITFGIYGIYWIYTICKKIKVIAGDASGCAGELICLLIVPFYNIYWAYTREEKFRKALGRRGLNIEDNRMLYVVLSIFGLFVIVQLLIQNDLNRIALLMNSGRPMGTGNAMNSADGGANNHIETLKGLAELRDNGLITEEEFNEKKKQLLSRM